MFLVPLVVFWGVKFGFRKSCQCKRNDKYEVCGYGDESSHGDGVHGAAAKIIVTTVMTHLQCQRSIVVPEDNGDHDEVNK